MYESPIIIEEIASVINRNEEEFILNCVREIGVSVNKEELIKALEYDRNQYEQGYNDGIRAIIAKLKCEFTVEAPVTGAEHIIISAEQLQLMNNIHF